MNTNQKKSIFYFSQREKKDLLIAWITISLAFAVVLLRVDILGGLIGASQGLRPELAFPVSFLAVGTGFVLHELAHREAAKHYGFHSEFRAWYPMLMLAVIFALFTGWILAAPGATYFFAQQVSRRQNGIISAAGPIINIIIGILLLLFSFLLGDAVIKSIIIYSAMINFWFALFNLIPFGPLDGSKVIAWNGGVWFILIAISAFLVFGLGLVF